MAWLTMRSVDEQCVMRLPLDRVTYSRKAAPPSPARSHLELTETATLEKLLNFFTFEVPSGKRVRIASACLFGWNVDEGWRRAEARSRCRLANAISGYERFSRRVLLMRLSLVHCKHRRNAAITPREDRAPFIARFCCQNTSDFFATL